MSATFKHTSHCHGNCWVHGWASRECREHDAGYQRGLAEGRKLGREEERATIVAWLRAKGEANHPMMHYLTADVALRTASDLLRADHLRPDSKDGEAK